MIYNPCKGVYARENIFIAPNLAVWQLNGRELVFFLRALIHQEPDGRNEPGKKDGGDNVPLILAILRTIKGCENAVDKTKTEVCINSCRAPKADYRCPCASNILNFPYFSCLI